MNDELFSPPAGEKTERTNWLFQDRLRGEIIIYDIIIDHLSQGKTEAALNLLQAEKERAKKGLTKEEQQ